MAKYTVDRSIPFYNMILRCETYDPQPVKMPDGYRIVPYRNGLEADWECAAGDFGSHEEAVSYFKEHYPPEKANDILFLTNGHGQAVGSCIAWTDQRQGGCVNSLHWLIVDAQHQGNGLGRTLCCAAMNRFCLRGRKPVYLHTQPWSWKAVLLYVSLGFRLQKTDSFAAYENQYHAAMETLKGVLTAGQYHLLELASDD